MKKKLLLLLLYLTGISMVGQNPTRFPYGVQIKGGQTATSTTSKIISQETDGTLNTIDAVNFPVSTATTNALELETDVSAGAVSGFTLTNNGNGTVNISSGIAYLRATNDPYAPIIKYPIAAVTNLALTDNANNYVLVDYNGGSPTLTVTTNGSIINTQTNSLAFLIARVGNNLDYLSLVGQNVDPNAKLRVRFLNQEGIRRASGAVLGFSNRNLTLTSSVLFSGLIRVNAAAFNTASPDTFTLAYNNGSTWTRTTGQTQINNTQYNVSGTLTTMPNNSFRTDYVYLLPNNPSKLYVIMGSTTYSSLTLAKAAPRPSILPVELQAIGLEVGRLFIEKNSTTIAEVQSSFSNDFIGAAVPEHNSLTGLQGGTSGEYNHLTNAQVSLVNGSEQTTNKSDSYTVSSSTTYATTKAIVDGLATKINSSSFTTTPTSSAFTHYFGETASDGIIRPKTLANVRTEVVTTATVDAAKPNIVTGTGTVNYFGKFNTSSTQNTGSLFETGGTVQTSLPFLVKNLVIDNKFSFVDAYGNSAFQNLTAGSNSFAFGVNAGNLSETSSPVTNVIRSIFIGASTRAKNTTSTNEIVIADQGIGLGDNTSVFGNAATLYGRWWGRLLLGGSVDNGTDALQVTGTASINNTLKLSGGYSQFISHPVSGWEIGFNNPYFQITNGVGAEFRLYHGDRLDLNTKLRILPTPATASGTPPLLTWNSTTKDVESVPYGTFAPSDSPSFTGTPTAPTATAGTNTTQIATTAFVTTANTDNVKLTGNQTVAGTKTFSNSLASLSRITGTNSADATTPIVQLQTQNTTYPALRVDANATGVTAQNITVLSGSTGLSITSNHTGSGATSSTLLSIDNKNTGNDMKPISVKKVGVEVYNVGHNGTMMLGVFTVATLPTPTTTAYATVTDATAPTYLGTLTGGGSVVCPVFYNGTAWVSH